MPTALAPGLPRLALDVLVYSEVPAERLVFINGRKYVEGQIVDEGAVIEQITPDGAILRHEGKQIMLRPKLNPYTRPTSP
jgi:general secretion pathway protein B